MQENKKRSLLHVCRGAGTKRVPPCLSEDYTSRSLRPLESLTELHKTGAHQNKESFTTSKSVVSDMPKEPNLDDNS